MAGPGLPSIYIALAVLALLAVTSMLAVTTLVREDARHFASNAPTLAVLRHQPGSERAGSGDGGSPSWSTPADQVGAGGKGGAGDAERAERARVAAERGEPPAELMEVWRPSRTAVVIPFIRCQLESRIQQNLARWHENPPCDPAKEEARPSALGTLSLVFHYNRDAEHEQGVLQSGKTLLEGLDELWEGLGSLRSCFRGGMQVVSANLTDTQDQYPLGPCVQFYNAFSLLEDLGFDHWFQMEPDVTPIRPMWGVELLRYSASNPGCRYWWQSGSSALYKNEVDFNKELDRSLDLHLNGNALYCLGAPDYDEFRDRVQRFYPPSGCRVSGTGKLDGFDHAMYRFRVAPENRQYMNGRFSKFRIADLILNYGIEAYNPVEVRANHPGAFFVHSRGVYGISAQLEKKNEDVKSMSETVSRAFYGEFGRVPEEEEAAFFLKAALDGRLQSIEETPCVLHQLLRLASSAVPGLLPGGPGSAAAAGCQPHAVLSVFPSAEYAQVFLAHGLVMQGPPNLKELAGLNVPWLPRSEEEAVAQMKAGKLTFADFAKKLCALNRFVPGKTLALLSICVPLYILTGSFRDSCSKDLKYDADHDALTGTCNDATGGKKRSTMHEVGLSCMTPPGNGNGELFCDRPWELAPQEERLGTFVNGHAGFARLYKEVFPATDFSGRELAPPAKLEEAKTSGQYRLWCMDLHAAPIGCNIPLLEDIGVSVEARIDFDNCKHHHTKLGDNLCASPGKPLKVFKFDNWRGFGLDPCPSLMREQFFDAYSDSFDLNNIDFFICSHPVANCELYMPFNRPIIVYATTRLEFGRHDQNVDWRAPELNKESPKRFREWVENLRAIARDPRNIVAANNAYDAAYIEYFTGVKARYIPSWCGGDASSDALAGAYAYRPRRMRVLILPYRTNLEYYPEDVPQAAWPDQHMRKQKSAFGHPVLQELREFLAGGGAPKGLTFASLRWEYGSEFDSPAVLRNHPAVIFLPYQFSTMSFFEAYRQSVPMLVPSKELLLTWVRKYRIMWERVYGDPARPSDLPGSPLPNPNSFDAATVAAWINTHDFYQGERFPHLLHFSSWQHAVELLQTTDLAQVGLKMHLHNQLEYARQRLEWTEALAHARAWADASRGLQPRRGVLRPGHRSPPNVTFALRKLYGLPDLPPDTKPGCKALWEEWTRRKRERIPRGAQGPNKCHA